LLIDFSNIKFIFVNKQAILALLKTKYANLGLSEKTLSGYADLVLAKLSTIEGDVTAEQVQTEIDGVEPFAKLAQSEADQARKSKAKDDKGKGKEGEGDDKDKGKGGADSGNDDPDPEPENGAPKWFQDHVKKLDTKIDALTSELTSMKAEKITGTRKQQFEALLDGLPDAVKQSQTKDFGRISFKDDEDFTSWLEEKKTDIGGLKQSLVLEDAHKFGPSTPKSQGGDGGKQASQQEIADVMSTYQL
jgi:hypothetical protein